MWGRTHCSSLLLCLAILAAIHNMNIKSTDKMAICFILQLHVLSEYGANTEWTHNTKTQTAKKSYFRYKKTSVYIPIYTKRLFICFSPEKMMYICIFRQKDIE